MSKLTKQEQQQYDKCLGQCTQCMLKPDCELRVKIRELRVLSIKEKLDIMVGLLDKAGLLDEFTAECERREREGN